MNRKNPNGPVGVKSPGRRASRTIGKRVSPWALCQFCGDEVQDMRFRNHPTCMLRSKR